MDITTTHTYTEEFDCSSVTYVNGVGTYQVPNTATIVEENESDSANVTVNCYQPVVAKNVQTAPLQREFEWEIVKGDDATYTDVIGDPANSHQYSIVVTRLGGEAGIITAVVEGEIFVSNPAGSPGNMTASVADQLNDGTNATVD